MNEDIQAAKRALRFKGLLIGKEDRAELGASIKVSPWLDVAHHIKEMLLEPVAVKESSRAHSKSIQAVARMLLESPSLQSALSVDHVRGCFRRPELVSDMECAAVIDAVNDLRGYVPKRQLKTSEGTAHRRLNTLQR